ncbi:MAG: selenocysteine-specific translation elongation factor [Bacillota bacterium]
MKYVTIGTAGHVDHGKTALIRALTGIDTDRLKEEKERGISIELGFAYLDLPSGTRAGIIDVPGHERFIKNMLAGVGGIDIVLLVVAADEGIMPQTKEHMDIVQILGINRGVVALTKTDLVDEEWLHLVLDEVRGYIATTSLAGAPIVPVSAVSGGGLQELVKVIDEMLQVTQEKPSVGPVRLPVDRVFTISGFGTVVTGTLVSGTVKEGDTLEVLPQGVSARVRSLQVHGKKTQMARAGQRVAVNLAGVEKQAVRRGNVLAVPNTFTPSALLDVRVFLLPAAKPLKNRGRIRLHIGTAEIMGRAVLLDRDELEPGASGYAQLIMEEPVVAGRNDRFVLRSVSPVTTIGGGVVLDPVARRHRRFKEDVLSFLNTLEAGTPQEKVGGYLNTSKVPVEIGEIAGAVHLDPGTVAGAVEELSSAGKVRVLITENQTFVFDAARYEELKQRVQGLVQAYHRQFPLREGYPKEELRSRLVSGVSNRVFQSLLQAMADDGAIGLQSQAVTAPGHGGRLPEKVVRVLDKLAEVYHKAGFQPPNLPDAASRLGLNPEEAAEFFAYLLRTNVLVKVGEEVYFHREALAKAREIIVGALKDRGELSPAEIRDLLNTSRKYTLPLLEYFDQKRVTKRVGDKRVLAQK